jgi:hypothetical protein
MGFSYGQSTSWAISAGASAGLVPLAAVWLLLAECSAVPELHPASDQKFTDFGRSFGTMMA